MAGSPGAAALDAVKGEFRRYRALADGALEQLRDDELAAPDPGGNSAAVLVWHLSGNLRSRFTNFLTSDGEKPWRNREEEFAARPVSRAELEEKWAAGWQCLDQALDALAEDDLAGTVTIRSVEHTVVEALLRSVSHVAYHTGQLVALTRRLRGGDWRYLSIPPGGSGEYNQNPTREKG